MHGSAESRCIDRVPGAYKALLVLSMLLVTIAYQPVLFDFFAGDDFVHLVWLKQTLEHPALILDNFYGNWLNITSTSFYRPLISVFMVLDYHLWKTNGLGFHVTNICFHLVSTTSAFFLARGLYQDAWSRQDAAARPEPIYDTGNANLYGLAAAMIFGLYPSHPEAVAWITGRVDAIVGAFMCLSMLCYRQWRNTRKASPYILSCVCFVLALMSKEMAITLPAVFFFYSLLLERNGHAAFSKRLFPALKAASPFFSILLLYFIVRTLALGTFVGGYDDALLPGYGLRHFINTWIQGLRIFLLPLNRELVGADNPIIFLWKNVLVVAGLFLLLNLARSGTIRRLTGFNLIFIALTFVPVYKVFAVGPDLQGSRLSYVPSIGLALIVAAAFVPAAGRLGFPRGVYRYACASLSLSYLALCFHGLWINNTAWADAGREANTIRSALAAEYEAIEGDPQVLLLNLPDNLNGAYVTRNAVDGMTKTPQFDRDVYNIVEINPVQSIFPFGYLKDSLGAAGSEVRIFTWSPKDAEFKSIVPGAPLQSGGRMKQIAWSGRRLEQITTPEPGLRSEHVLELSERGLECFDLEILTVGFDLDSSGPQAVSGNMDAVLYYSNRMAEGFSVQRSIQARLRSVGGRYIATFPLSSRADWALGGEAGKLKLVFPVPGRIVDVEFHRKDELMPRLLFENSGYLGSKGFLHLTDTRRTAQLDIEAGSVSGAVAAYVALTRPNKRFARLNSSVPERDILRKIAVDKSGTITLDRSMFPSTGFYELRAWRLDESGKIIGLAGDHIVVAVDS